MNIGLVLSGGMAKGAYQIGALKALDDFIPVEEIKYISCASVGVLNGYAYATHKLQKAELMWKNICDENERMFISQILRNSLLHQNIESIYCKEDSLPSAFYISLLDFFTKNIVYKNLRSADSEKVPLYLKASVAMPIYNRAVVIDGISYYDGAIADNIPVFPLIKHSIDYIICIYFDDSHYRFENTYFDNKVIKITFPCESALKQSLIFRKDNIESMIQEGYNRAAEVLGLVFQKGYENLDYIYNVIKSGNLEENHVLRITGDVIVTNLNKIAQKFAGRKVI